MTEKRQQHYVPKFALRHFAVDEDRKQLDICLPDSYKIIRGASLRDQCSKPHFYSKHRWVEDGLGILEGILANVLREIISTGNLPRKQKANISLAVSLQNGRTEKSVGGANSLVDKMAKIFLSGNVSKEILEKVSISDRSASLLSLSRSIQGWPAILDLNQYLLINKTNTPFIFSDNPVIFSNWFFKGRYDQYAAIGTAASGLQIILPISRIYAIYLHDHNVYTLDHNNNSVELKLDDDLNNLNNLQFRNSSKCLYVNESFDIDSIKSICKGERYDASPEVKRYRKISPGSYMVTDRDEFSGVTEAGSELIMMRKPTPDFAIRFKGLSIRSKPRVNDNGSTEGPMRDPPWTRITTRYGKLAFSSANRVDDFWSFAERQPEFEYVGGWLERDSRVAKMQNGNAGS